MGSAPDSGFFDIQDSQLTALKDSVIVITGGSSGIGLAATQIALKLGAKVVVGDINECPEKNGVTFQQTDTRNWNSQAALFKKAIEVHGKIDHVFANAGIGPVDNFITDKFDSNGELLPPNMKTMEVNLNGPIYTSKLGIHYLRKNPAGGSVVITASASSFTPFEANDYGTAKHGTLGLMRNFTACLQGTNIRCNCITPLWTASGLVPAAAMKEMLGITSQPPEAAARSALICMADKERNGQAIYSRRSEFKEVNSILMGAMFPAMDVGPEDMPADEAAKEKFSAFFKPQTYNEQYGHN